MATKKVEIIHEEINIKCVELFNALTASVATNAQAISGMDTLITNHLSHMNEGMTTMKADNAKDMNEIKNSIRCLALVAKSPEEAEEIRKILKDLPSMRTKFNIAAGIFGIIGTVLVSMALYQHWF
jgi:hypothetical protein